MSQSNDKIYGSMFLLGPLILVFCRIIKGPDCIDLLYLLFVGILALRYLFSSHKGEVGPL